MNEQTLGMITLLRSALKNETLTLPKDFDWYSACQILYEHHLTGLGIRGAVRCGVSAANPELRSLTAQLCKEIAASRLQMQQLERVYALFEAHGIKYVPLKGAMLKALYPQPELRTMGDADILIQQEQYSMIQTLLPSIGMKEDSESDHEYVWSGSGLKLELHKRLMPTYNADYYSYYGDGWERIEIGETGAACHLTREDHFIYLLVHFAKHYRIGSVSAKNICDFWVYRKAYPDMDETYIQMQMQKLEMTGFYQNILQLLNTWFDGAVPTEATERITEAVFRGGVCSPEEAQIVFMILRQEKETTSFAERKRRYLLDRIFPPLKQLSLRYPVLKRCPVLLPLFWIIRWPDALLRRPQNIKYSIEASKYLLHMEEEQIETYKKNLNAIGLDAKFTK